MPPEIMSCRPKATPPLDFVKQKDTVVIISSRLPPVVYFNKAITLLEAQILAKPSPNSKNVSIELVACGGAISRCKQVARYVVQELKGKYKHLVTNVTKSATLAKESVCVQRNTYSDSNQVDEENAFDIIPDDRLVDQVRIRIEAQTN